MRRIVFIIFILIYTLSAYDYKGVHKVINTHGNGTYEVDLNDNGQIEWNETLKLFNVKIIDKKRLEEYEIKNVINKKFHVLTDDSYDGYAFLVDKNNKDLGAFFLKSMIADLDYSNARNYNFRKYKTLFLMDPEDKKEYYNEADFVPNSLISNDKKRSALPFSFMIKCGYSPALENTLEDKALDIDKIQVTDTYNLALEILSKPDRNYIYGIGAEFQGRRSIEQGEVPILLNTGEYSNTPIYVVGYFTNADLDDSPLIPYINFKLGVNFLDNKNIIEAIEGDKSGLFLSTGLTLISNSAVIDISYKDCRGKILKTRSIEKEFNTREISISLGYIFR